MSAFEPVRTLEDLYALDVDQICEGYRSYERGDPEPGANRGRAFWHGWRNAKADLTGETDEAQRQLAAAYAQEQRRVFGERPR